MHRLSDNMPKFIVCRQCAAQKLTWQKNINEIGAVINIYRKLIPISRQLRLIGERQCNGYADTDWGRKQEARDAKKVENLLNRAISLADEIGLQVYHQSDPRGVALYLVTCLMDSSSYTNGIAIY